MKFTRLSFMGMVLAFSLFVTVNSFGFQVELAAKIKMGQKVWNEWISINPNLTPDLTEAVIMNVDLSGVWLRGALMEYTMLMGANLKGAHLNGALLIGANLQKADLTDANLMRANLVHADLQQANLTNANLSNTDLRGTNLSSANLTNVFLKNALINSATQFPPDYHPKGVLYEEEK